MRWLSMSVWRSPKCPLSARAMRECGHLLDRRPTGSQVSCHVCSCPCVPFMAHGRGRPRPLSRALRPSRPASRKASLPKNKRTPNYRRVKWRYVHDNLREKRTSDHPKGPACPPRTTVTAGGGTAATGRQIPPRPRVAASQRSRRGPASPSATALLSFRSLSRLSATYAHAIARWFFLSREGHLSEQQLHPCTEAAAPRARLWSAGGAAGPASVMPPSRCFALPDEGVGSSFPLLRTAAPAARMQRCLHVIPP